DINAAIDILSYVQTALSPDVQRGGRLYDNWWDENGLDAPIARNSLWPAAGSSLTPPETWRCVNCHGWDYTGTEGFVGLLSPVQDVKSFITNGTVLTENDHAFSEKLKQQDIADLTAFVMNPVDGIRSDIETLINEANDLSGQQIYENETPGNCVFCHGVDGTSIPTVDLKTLAGNFGPRFVHVARFGSPGSIMLPGLSRYTGLSAQSAADVQAYAKNLGNTVATPATGLERGGRLFDNWFAEMKAVDSNFPDPVVKNPLWETRNPAVPDVQSLSDSWRCVNCHNWTYKGRDILADQPDADNLIVKLKQRSALYPTDEALADYLYNWIKSGTGTVHNYGTAQSGLPGVLGDRELNELVVFLMQGVKDNSTYIYDVDGKVINADPVNGGKIYSGTLYPDVNCESCHGAQGTETPPGSGRTLDIFKLATENSWKFLHKIRFAAPASEMPALEGIPQVSFQDMLDVLGYAQSQAETTPP
ncbi:MAG: hypothetical protein R3240_12800, partial [Gammaproteobacteria bacterium]|nr:hypothetical protein [Gammaproteobacteria bacterium]